MRTIQRELDDIVYAILSSSSGPNDLDARLYLHACHHPLSTLSHHAKLLGRTYEAIRRATRRLIAAGWAFTVKPMDGRRGMLLVPWMPPDVEDEVAKALTRLRTEINFYGEWLMKCALDLLVHDRDCHDNTRPEWLTHPGTGQRLELDRLYRGANVAFEFQGQQHRAVDGHYIRNQEELERRMETDQVKRDLCEQHGVTLIEIHQEDLEFNTLLAKLGDTLPLFPLPEQGPLVRQLHAMCSTHALRAQLS